MGVDKKLIRDVADVARLNLSDKEVNGFISDFNDILSTFSVIDECDTEGIEPSFQPVKINDVVREDKVKDSLSQEEALSNTKHKKDGYFKGPRAV